MIIESCLLTSQTLPFPTPVGKGSTSNSKRSHRGFGIEQQGKGKTEHWLTPPALLHRLGEFDLDSCGCVGMPWRTATTTYFLPEHDGLVEPWFGRVWCNPPYGHGIEEPWLKRMAQHGNGMLLIFARTDTIAWQKYVFPYADAFLFLAGRMQFRLPSGEPAKSGTAPSVLLAYGQNNVEVLRKSGLAGTLFLKPEILSGVKASKL